jgi:predicted DsbA family dithiol-disulfide isomerase
MHELLFHHQRALEDDDLLDYAIELGLEVWPFENDRASRAALERVRRDVHSGVAAGVHGTPTLFINGVLHAGGYDVDCLLKAVGGSGGSARESLKSGDDYSRDLQRFSSQPPPTTQGTGTS